MRVPSPTSASRLPSATALRGPSGEGGTPEAFGAGIARSVSNLAANTMALGGYIREQEEKKNRFLALKNFSSFQADMALEMTELQRNYDPKSGNYYEQAGQLYRTKEKEFISTYIPKELQEEFSVRTSEVGANHALQAAKFQYESNDQLFKQGINDALNEARITLGQDGSKDTLERERQRLDEIIESTNLSEAEKVAIRREVYKGLEGVAYRSAHIERLRNEQSGVGTDVGQAQELLEVQGGLNREEAAANVVAGRNAAVEAVGSVDVWATLPERARAVLIAVAAEKDGLSNETIRAARAGDMEALAEAILAEGAAVSQTGRDLILNPEAGIDDDPAFDNLPYEDRLALLGDAEREMAAEITAQKKAESEHRASLVNSLHVALMEGDAGQSDIDKMIELGYLDDYDDRKKAYDILAKADEGLSMRQLGMSILEGKMTFAPGNTDHEKALDALVGKDGLASIDAMDSEYAANGLIPLIRQAQGVPGDVEDLLQGMIRSQNPDRAYWALDLMAQIERASPTAFLQFNEHDRAKVDFWQTRRDYMNQEELLTKIRGPLNDAERNGRAAIRAQGTKLFTDVNARSSLVNFDPVSLFSYPGWLLGLPSAPEPPVTLWAKEQLNSDFQTLFLDNYELYGDVEEAKSAAQMQLQRVWGITRTGADNKLMKYPPEMIYPRVRESHDWMEAQLRRDGIIAEDEQFSLITDEQTENEWGTGAAPSYVLAKIDEGRTEIMFDPMGKPMRFAFDFGLAEQEDELAWKEEQRKAQEFDELKRQVDDALQHMIDTGNKIPEEFFNADQPGGLFEMLMQGEEQ